MQPLTIEAGFHILGARSSVDRVLASEAKGRRFDSCRAHQPWGVLTYIMRKIA